MRLIATQSSNRPREKLCYIALDYDTVLTSTTESSDNDTTYVLPDGNNITVGAERFRCPDVVSAKFHW